MNLVFLLNNFYPYGGLERNFLKIADACVDSGSHVHVFTMSWEGKRPSGLEITLLPGRGFTNHARSISFSRLWQKKLLGTDYDLRVGFNRMPGLDLYYAADVCYALDIANRRSRFSRLTPRYRVYSQFEKAVFSPESGTHIMYLSETEKENYIRTYGTPEERFHYLPPGIDKAWIRQAVHPTGRCQVRGSLNIAKNEFMLIMVGSDFQRKGLIRSIRALAALPENLRLKTHLFVIGKGRSGFFMRAAQRLNIGRQLHFLGVCSDVPAFLAGADLLLHPAVAENTGNVILEALVAGVPVLATGNCGYGFHVDKARAGALLQHPFRQQEMNAALGRLLLSDELGQLGQNGYTYADQTDFYSRPGAALKIIEELVQQKRAAPSLPISHGRL